MGLDTTHGCWNGAYSSFNRFRHSLANQIGVNLDDYIGYGGDKPFKTLKHNIEPLLNHSDCDGKLSVSKCKKIVLGLNSILENFNPDLPSDFNFKERIIQFRDGCLFAISVNEAVEFH